MQPPKRKLLLCLTSESHSESAFNWVLCSLLQESDSLSMIIVIPPSSQNANTFTSCYAATPPSALSESLTAAHRTHVQEACTRFMHSKEQQVRAKFPQVSVQVQVVEGDAKEQIIEAALRLKPDLLVMGSKSIGRLRQALLGSVSDYCVHHSPFPVLIIKEHREGQSE